MVFNLTVLEKKNNIKSQILNKNFKKNNLKFIFIKKDSTENFHQRNSAQKSLLKRIIERSQTINSRELCTNLLIETWSSDKFEFQKEFSNLQEKFLKNSKVLSSRYELYHLSLAELIYLNKKKKKMTSYFC